ncbi:hypothetical protein AAHB33_18050 [Paenarthrobacter sp. S56]|uniref:hypothetical protein n=1 Tax=Paenarthrobacter sp. S56 TaxID=3138179 RepID=UPI00321B69BD
MAGGLEGAGALEAGGDVVGLSLGGAAGEPPPWQPLSRTRAQVPSRTGLMRAGEKKANGRGMTDSPVTVLA